MTFTYTPDFGAQRDIQPRVRTASFGDGYEQRQSDGINSMFEIWSLTFSMREQSEGDAIASFLRTQGAVSAFDWTPPLASSSIKVVCKSWKYVVEKAGRVTITAKFEQRFEV